MQTRGIFSDLIERREKMVDMLAISGLIAGAVFLGVIF
jgi:hypothetical protein